MKILIIEDEPKVASFIHAGLKEKGFECDVVYDGFMGKKFALTRAYDIILMDVVIPYVNGIELCRDIKSERPGIPILMLTALGSTSDKVNGFDAGADDYLVKPFEFAELLARIRALTKRYQENTATADKLVIGDTELDLNKKIVKRAGQVIELTAKEFALLEYFMRNRGKVLSRAEISEHVWDIHFDTETNVVDVYVNMLRKKIEKGFDSKLIHTRIGMGYIFDTE